MTDEDRKATASPAHTDPDSSQAESVPPEHATYNIVSDTVTGVNIRKSDNLFQAIFTLISVLLLAGCGAVFAAISDATDVPWYGAALIGGFMGLVVGIFASGFFLMIYRALRHIKGKHD